MVAVTPAIHRSLNQSPLSSQTWIELSQGPPYCVAFRLVVQSIALVLVLRATCAWIYAILRLEFWCERVCVYRFNVAANRILHLHSVS